MMTKYDAMRLYESKFWEKMTLRDRAVFQLHEEKLCMPFGVFHEAMEATLGRPIFTHEFAFPDALRKEMNGEKPAPTFDEILALIPEDKRIIVAVA